jgi:hypothetical protein
MFIFYFFRGVTKSINDLINVYTSAAPGQVTVTITFE